MKKFTRYVNTALPVMLNELNGKTPSNLERVEPEGARPHYVAKDVEIPTLYDYTLAHMLKERMLKGFDDVMKFLSYYRLVEDLKIQKNLKKDEKKG